VPPFTVSVTIEAGSVNITAIITSETRAAARMAEQSLALLFPNTTAASAFLSEAVGVPIDVALISPIVSTIQILVELEEQEDEFEERLKQSTSVIFASISEWKPADYGIVFTAAFVILLGCALCLLRGALARCCCCCCFRSDKSDISSAEALKGSGSAKNGATEGVRSQNRDARSGSFLQLSGGGTGAEDEWEEHVDDQTGNLYWHNPKLGDTTWTNPHATLDTSGLLPAPPSLPSPTLLPPPPPPPPPPSAAGLSPGWEALVGDDGTPYYFNTLTGETQWDAPSVRF